MMMMMMMLMIKSRMTSVKEMLKGMVMMVGVSGTSCPDYPGLRAVKRLLLSVA